MEDPRWGGFLSRSSIHFFHADFQVSFKEYCSDMKKRMKLCLVLLFVAGEWNLDLVEGVLKIKWLLTFESKFFKFRIAILIN